MKEYIINLWINQDTFLGTILAILMGGALFWWARGITKVNKKAFTGLAVYYFLYEHKTKGRKESGFRRIFFEMNLDYYRALSRIEKQMDLKEYRFTSWGKIPLKDYFISIFPFGEIKKLW